MVFPHRRKRQPSELQAPGIRRPLRSPSPPPPMPLDTVPPVPLRSSIFPPSPLSPPLSPRMLNGSKAELDEERREQQRSRGVLAQNNGTVQGRRDELPNAPGDGVGSSSATGRRSKFLSFPWKKRGDKNSPPSPTISIFPTTSPPLPAQIFQQHASSALRSPIPGRLASYGPPTSPPPSWSLPAVPTVIVSSPTQSTVSTTPSPTASPLVNNPTTAIAPMAVRRPDRTRPTSSRNAAWVSSSDEEELDDLISRWRNTTPTVSETPTTMDDNIFSLMLDGPVVSPAGSEADDKITPLPASRSSKSSLSHLREGPGRQRSKRASARFSGLPYSRDSVISTNVEIYGSSSRGGVRLPSIQFDGISMDSVFAEVERKMSLASTSSTSIASDKRTRRRTRVLSMYGPVEDDVGATSSSSVATNTTRSTSSSRSLSSPPTSSCNSIAEKATSMASRSTSSGSSSTSSSRQSRHAGPLNSSPLARPLPRRVSSRPTRPSPLNIAAANAVSQLENARLVAARAISTSEPYDGLISPLPQASSPSPSSSPSVYSLTPVVTSPVVCSSPDLVPIPSPSFRTTSTRTCRTRTALTSSPSPLLPSPSPAEPLAPSLPEFCVRPPTPTTHDGDWEPLWGEELPKSPTTVTPILLPETNAGKTQIRISTRAGAGAKRTAPPIRRATTDLEQRRSYFPRPITPTTPTFQPHQHLGTQRRYTEYPSSSSNGRVSPAFSASSTVVPVAPLTPRQGTPREQRTPKQHSSPSGSATEDPSMDSWGTTGTDVDDALEGLLARLKGAQTPPPQKTKLERSKSQKLTAQALQEHLRRIQLNQSSQASESSSEDEPSITSVVQNHSLSPAHPRAPSRTSQPDAPISDFYRSDQELELETVTPSVARGHRRVSSISVEEYDEDSPSSLNDSVIVLSNIGNTGTTTNHLKTSLSARDLVISLSKLSFDIDPTASKRSSFATNASPVSDNEESATPEVSTPIETNHDADENPVQFEPRVHSRTDSLPEGFRITPPTPSPTHSAHSSISDVSSFISSYTSSDSNSSGASEEYSLEDLDFFPAAPGTVILTTAVVPVRRNSNPTLQAIEPRVNEEGESDDIEGTLTRSTSNSTDLSLAASSSEFSSGSSELGVLTFGERVRMSGVVYV